MILRGARPQERAGLEDLQRRASLMWADERPFLLANPDVIELPLAHIQAGFVRVVEQEGVALAFSVLLPRADDALLEGLFVTPQCWGRGLGRRLVEDAAARARTAGLAALEVVANHHAQGFYERLGFETAGVAQTPFGPALRLRRGLNSGKNPAIPAKT